MLVGSIPVGVVDKHQRLATSPTESLFKIVPSFNSKGLLTVCAAMYILTYRQESIWIRRSFLKMVVVKQYASPKLMRLQETRVYVKRIKGVVMLIPKKGDPWKTFVDSLDKFSDDFMSVRPDQGRAERRKDIE